MAAVRLSSLLFSVVISTLLVQAVPLEPSSVTPIGISQINSYTPYTWFASTAYCLPSKTINWSCGADCDANSDFIPVNSGGDGDGVQYWYVGYSPSLKSVVVAHQGTNTSEILAVATDINILLENLDPKLFPGIGSSVKCHSGFANEQAKTATLVLSAVKSALEAHGASKVAVVGHSLGAAIALLDAIYLPLHLPGIAVRAVTYGMPRVGNQAFANYVDAHLRLDHINNKKDPVPIVPGRLLGYHHPSGEVHITESGTWESCSGQDNTDKLCIVGDVPNIFEGNTANHGGPYNGITMGC